MPFPGSKLHSDLIGLGSTSCKCQTRLGALVCWCSLKHRAERVDASKEDTSNPCRSPPKLPIMPRDQDRSQAPPVISTLPATLLSQADMQYFMNFGPSHLLIVLPSLQGRLPSPRDLCTHLTSLTFLPTGWPSAQPGPGPIWFPSKHAALHTISSRLGSPHSDKLTLSNTEPQSVLWHCPHQRAQNRCLISSFGMDGISRKMEVLGTQNTTSCPRAIRVGMPCVFQTVTRICTNLLT